MIGFDPTAVRTSAEGPEWRVGSRFCWDDEEADAVAGSKEFIYVSAAEAITGAGYVCVMDSDYDAEMLDTTSSAPGAGQGMPVGVAMAAIASGGYGWLQICGRATVRTLASAAVGTELNATATPGALDDDGSSGAEVVNGIALGTATGTAEANNDDAYLTYPHVGRTL